MTSFHHIVKKEEANMRIDKLLATILSNISRSEIQRWITESNVTVNARSVKSNYKCQRNDEINGTISEKQPILIEPENIPLSIVYEDEDIIVINKPQGMVVHPSNAHQSGTLVHALLYHSEHLSTIAGNNRPGIVHRLDKDTNGLLLIAKKDNIHRALAKQFAENKIKRTYEAIVHGVIDHDSGLIDAPIGRDPANRLQMKVVDEGKTAITHFHVLKRYETYTHVRCQLETGRTHQIRVHMQYIGHPVLGDPKYSKGMPSLGLDGQALYAKKLEFNHPGQNEDVGFEIEQPAYFQKMIMQM